jgi:hypothetical protein
MKTKIRIGCCWHYKVQICWDLIFKAVMLAGIWDNGLKKRVYRSLNLIPNKTFFLLQFGCPALPLRPQ